MRRMLMAGLVLGAGVWLAVAAEAKDPVKDVAAVNVTGEHLEQTSRCNKGGAIHILANNSRISVLGDCTKVYIEGSRNWVMVENADRIVFKGNLNTVLYDERWTRVTDEGGGNSALEHWPQ